MYPILLISGRFFTPRGLPKLEKKFLITQVMVLGTAPEGGNLQKYGFEWGSSFGPHFGTIFGRFLHENLRLFELRQPSETL